MNIPLAETPLYLDIRTSSHRGPMMTGTGITRDYCGDNFTDKKGKVVRIVCSDKPGEHHYRVHKMSCHDLLCPVCWPSRATELARKSGEKVWAFHEITQGNKPSHWSFNMAPHMFPSLFQEEDMIIRKVRDWGVTQAKAAGIIGAHVQPHLYRIKKQFQAKFSGEADRRNKVQETCMEISRRWNRYDIVREQANWRDFVDYAPHVHLVGYGYLPRADQFKKKFGFTYRKHGNLNTVGDVQACINYLLSHAPVARGVQVYSSFGVLGNNQLITIGEKESIEVCQDCGKPMINEATGEPVYIKTRIFTLRKWLPRKDPPAKGPPGEK